MNEVAKVQLNSLNLSNFISDTEKYSNGLLNSKEVGDLLTSAISGQVDNKALFNGIWNLLGEEILSTLTILASVLAIIVIHSIIKSISENLGNESVAKITYYVQYILIVTIVMTNFSHIINFSKETISNLVGFMYTLVPILISLMVATGNITSATLVEPIILFSIVFVGNIITTVIIPILLISTVLNIVSNISEKVQIEKLSKFFKSGIVWFLGTIITIFVSILSLEGTLTSSVDGITSKGVKSLAANLIPVVGKALSDATDTVLGSTILLKNAIGIVGMIIIVGICIIPILKLSILTITYYFTSAICEPLADKKIITLISNLGDTFKILLAVVFFISIMLIIGVAIVIKISNGSAMYR